MVGLSPLSIAGCTRASRTKEITYYPKAADHENAKKQWYIVDASDKCLGRLASTVAIHIRSKHLLSYTPSTDMGACVIIVNAEKVAVTSKKRSQKPAHLKVYKGGNHPCVAQTPEPLPIKDKRINLVQ